MFPADMILRHFGLTVKFCLGMISPIDRSSKPAALKLDVSKTVFMVTKLMILTDKKETIVLNGEKDTSYIGPPEKAAEFFQSLRYRRAISQQLTLAGIGPYKALQLEIKHKCSKN